jgi:hypothetical protein
LKITFSIFIAPDFMDLAFCPGSWHQAYRAVLALQSKPRRVKSSWYVVCASDVLAHLLRAVLFITLIIFEVPILGYRTSQEYVRGAKYQ